MLDRDERWYSMPPQRRLDIEHDCYIGIYVGNFGDEFALTACTYNDNGVPFGKPWRYGMPCKTLDSAERSFAFRYGYLSDRAHVVARVTIENGTHFSIPLKRN